MQSYPRLAEKQVPTCVALLTTQEMFPALPGTQGLGTSLGVPLSVEVKSVGPRARLPLCESLGQLCLVHALPLGTLAAIRYALVSPSAKWGELNSEEMS